MSVTIQAPHDLRALLATMKSAKDQRVNMNVWDRDIKTIEDAIEIIEHIRSGPSESLRCLRCGMIDAFGSVVPNGNHQ